MSLSLPNMPHPTEAKHVFPTIADGDFLDMYLRIVLDVARPNAEKFDPALFAVGRELLKLRKIPLQEGFL